MSSEKLFFFKKAHRVSSSEPDQDRRVPGAFVRVRKYACAHSLAPQV